MSYTVFKILPAVNWNNCEAGDEVHWIVCYGDNEKPMLCHTIEEAFDWVKSVVASDLEILADDAKEKKNIKLRQTKSSGGKDV